MKPIKQRYKNLAHLPDDATPQEKRQRGRDFEDLLSDLLADEGLSPRIRFRPDGEEIDGSIEVDGRIILIEAKWHKVPLPASSVYAFKSKVDGKLVGTIGVFISMSDFSPNAVDALGLGKDINVILFNRDDFESCLEVGFKPVLMSKLRYAAEEGLVFWPFTTTRVTSRAVDDQVESDYNIVQGWPEESLISGGIAVVCEGPIDKVILSRLTSRILNAERLNKNVQFITSQGKLNIPKFANSISQLSNSRVVVVVDSDGDPMSTERYITKNLEFSPLAVIVVHPEIETWLYPGDQPRINAMRDMTLDPVALAKKLDKLNLNQLRQRSDSFSKFYNVITQ